MPTATTSWQGGRREDEEKKEEGEKQPLIKSNHPHLAGMWKKELLKKNETNNKEQMRNAIKTKHETNEKHMLNKNMKHMSKNETWLWIFFAKPTQTINFTLSELFWGKSEDLSQNIPRHTNQHTAFIKPQYLHECH